MVKSLELQAKPSYRRFNLPLKLIIFWYKRLSIFINSKKFENIRKEEYPKIFISHKYPQMSILELYQRINHHLFKYFPDIFRKLNSNNKEYIIKQNKHSYDDKESENNKNIINDFEKPKNLTDEKTSDIIIDLKNHNELSKDIKLLNEKNCNKINHLFKPHKFTNEICEKYNNCFVKEVLIKKEENNIININEDNNKNISPSKSTSTISSKSHGKKINYLTYSKNFIIKKSKYFNNDDYFLKKLSEIGNQNNNEVK